MKQVELVTVQRLLHGVDDDIYIVSRKVLSNLVAGTHATTVTLLQV